MENTLRDGGAQERLTLFETVFWTGEAAPLWPRHAARAKASLAALGWEARDVPAPQGPATPARLRLTLQRTGAPLWEEFALPPTAASWRVRLAHSRLASQDPWLRHKTSRRALHDAERATLEAGVDEALFLNERGEVCEGTITNVFFDRGAGLRTPPLTSGLLPGVLRAHLAPPEEVLRVEDLGKVRLWVGNALRGLIVARF